MLSTYRSSGAEDSKPTGCVENCWICQSSRSGLELEQNVSLFLKLAYWGNKGFILYLIAIAAVGGAIRIIQKRRAKS